MKFNKITILELSLFAFSLALSSCKETSPSNDNVIPAVETFTATFKQDGQTLKVYTLGKGAQIVYTGMTPSKNPDVKYTYSFTG